MSNPQIIPVQHIAPALLSLDDIRDTFRWYRLNLCEAELRDPRECRVRFLPENFIHLIKLTNKYGAEPKNARMALEEIERGRIKFAAGRFDPQRTAELSWVRLIIVDPWRIVRNWQVLGRGDEAYIRNFGTNESPTFRVLVCEVIGTVRQAITVFPRERTGEKELQEVVWP